MPKIFMSHATADKAEVEWVANTLRELRPDLEFWIDNWSMVPGDSLIAKINEGLTAADRLVVFLTPDSVRSSWVTKELEAGLVLGIARQRGFPGSNFVIPVVFKKLPANYVIPPLLAPTLYADFTTTEFNAACAHLLRGILGTPAGPSATKLTNLTVTWEYFEPVAAPGKFGARMTFSARLTPEPVNFTITVKQHFESAAHYFGDPGRACLMLGFFEERFSHPSGTGAYMIKMEQPRIEAGTPFVVELISDKPWVEPPSYGLFTVWDRQFRMGP